MKLSHIRGIDSIRAVGVIFVVTYHLFTNVLPGGFFGVDIFFVISGFLVTALLAKEFNETGAVDIIKFYGRRVRRLLPAAAFMVVITLALSLLISPDMRVGMREQTAAVFGWMTNYFEIMTGGSYENQLLPHLFVHTWTLGVEMHYYLIWGLIMGVVCMIYSRAAGRIDHMNRFVYGMERKVVSEKLILFLFCAGIAVFAYVRMQMRFPELDDPSPVYYATSTRIFPLMVGSALGALTGMRTPQRRLTSPPAVLFIAVSLIIIFYMARNFTFSGPDTYKYGIMVASLLTALMIFCVLSLQPKKFFADIPPLAVLGKRAYSIYLFHWPLYNIFKQMAFAGTWPFKDDTPHHVYAIAAIACTLLLAEISYRVFELGRGQKAAAAAAAAAKAAAKAAALRAERAGDDRAWAQAELRMASQAAPQQEQMEQVSRRRPGKLAGLAAAIFCVCSVLSAYTLATAPSRTNIEEDYLHQEVLTNIYKMEQYNGYLSELKMNPVAMHGKTKKLPPKPSEVEKGLDIEGDAEQTQENADKAVIRDDPEGPVLPIAPPGGANVTLIGDSVPLGAADILRQTIGSIVVDAEVSRNMFSGAELITDYAQKGELGEYVVLALFTNPLNVMEDPTNDTIAAIPAGHKVIAVTPYGKDYMEKTAEMVRRLPQWYDFITVADWNAAIRDHRDLLAGDGIHMKGDDSKQIYANLIAQAIEQASKKPAKQ